MWGLVVLALIRPAPILPGPFLVGCLIMAFVATIIAIRTGQNARHETEKSQSWDQYMNNCRGRPRNDK